MEDGVWGGRVCGVGGWGLWIRGGTLEGWGVGFLGGDGVWRMGGWGGVVIGRGAFWGVVKGCEAEIGFGSEVHDEYLGLMKHYL